jgi:hypothetical protein
MDQSENTENQEQNKNEPSEKQRIELARGKNIPIDHFLYSCLEHERTQRAQFGDDLPTAGRWPLIVGATAENLPSGFEGQDITALMNRLCGWYAAQYPDIVEEIPLDHEVLNLVVGSFMNFTIDLAELVYLKTHTSLPSHNSDAPESQALWKTIATALKESFPGYHGYFIRFLKWAFADIEPEEFEPGSRPPVGKNMPNFRAMANAQNFQQTRQGSNKPHGGGSHGGGQHSGSKQGGGRDRHQQNRSQGGGSHGGGRHGGGQHGGGQQGGGRDNQRHRGPQQHGGGQPRHQTNQPADQEIEKLALQAVDEAISRISSAETDEVFLKPMNSFYRRIQHQYAVDKGYESCSVGEGNERGVKVSKPLAK